MKYFEDPVDFAMDDPAVVPVLPEEAPVVPVPVDPQQGGHWLAPILSGAGRGLLRASAGGVPKGQQAPGYLSSMGLGIDEAVQADIARRRKMAAEQAKAAQERAKELQARKQWEATHGQRMDLANLREKGLNLRQGVTESGLNRRHGDNIEIDWAREKGLNRRHGVTESGLNRRHGDNIEIDWAKEKGLNRRHGETESGRNRRHADNIQIDRAQLLLRQQAAAAKAQSKEGQLATLKREASGGDPMAVLEYERALQDGQPDKALDRLYNHRDRLLEEKRKPPTIRTIREGNDIVSIQWDPDTGGWKEVSRGQARGMTKEDAVLAREGARQFKSLSQAREAIVDALSLVKDPSYQASGVAGAAHEHVGGLLQQGGRVGQMISDVAGLKPVEAKVARTVMRDVTNQTMRMINTDGKFSDGDRLDAARVASGEGWSTSEPQYESMLMKLLEIVERRMGSEGQSFDAARAAGPAAAAGAPLTPEEQEELRVLEQRYGGGG